MTSKMRTIPLSAVVDEVLDSTDIPTILRPGEESFPVIVERGERLGVYYIVDGFHRVAGFAAWADENNLDYRGVKIRVVVSDSVELIQRAAEPGSAGHREAIETILEEAGIYDDWNQPKRG